MAQSEISVLTESVSEDLLEKKITLQISDQAQRSIYERSFLVKDIYTIDWSPFAATDKPLTLTSFYNLVADLLSDQQARDGIVEEDRIPLVADYPYDRVHELGNGVITYRTIRREPAALGADNKSFVHRGWQHYYEIAIPEMPKHKMIVERRLVKHTIEFSVWSKSARIANTKVLWLENTLINNTYLFQAKGADRFLWDVRLADTYINVSGQPLFQRPLRFTVNLNTYRIKAAPTISHINLKVEPEEYLILSSIEAAIFKKLIHSEE